MAKDKLGDFPDVLEFLQRPLPSMLLRRVQELIWTVRRLRSRTPALDSTSEGTAPSKPLPTPVSFSIIISCSGDGKRAETLNSLSRQGDKMCEAILWAPTPIPTSGIAPRAFPVRVERDLATAVRSASGDFVIVLDQGDSLVDGALDCIADMVRASGSDVVYCDETQRRDGSSAPIVCLKPSWSPELLESFNYFGHATAIRGTLAVRALDGAPKEVSGPAHEWDLNLRVSELTQRIDRIQKTLCNRAPCGGRDARCADAKDNAAHIAVLTDYWRRQGIEATVLAFDDGTFRAEWPLAAEPLVSIIIPNRDRANLLRTCVEGIYEKTNYKNVELIIVDNGSKEPETRALYDEIIKRGAMVIMFDQDFNYSRACNMGAAEARGELLLFLNNDIEMIEPDWLTHLVRAAMRPGVGIVGPKLLYPDGGIQHAGVVVGLFTLAAHVFHRAPAHWGPLGSPETARNWMAVTGACQLISRSVFDRIGGYDETFIIAYSDVVLCLDAATFGYRTVYLPQSTLVHHEGKTRGFENPTYDQVLFARRLRALGVAADPFFHEKLDTLEFSPTLAETPRENDELTQVQIDVATLTADDPIAGTLDIFDDGLVAAATGKAWEKIAGPPRGPLASGPDAMAGTMINFLRRRPDLRTRFPRALSDGASGDFAAWMKGEIFALDATRVQWIEAAFAADFGARARQILLYDEALRQREPLFLLPIGRPSACRVLFDAHDRGQLSLTSIWWFLLTAAEEPIGELHATWAITPAWQASVPTGGSVFGTVALVRWVAETYDIKQAWLFAQGVPHSPSPAAQVRLAYNASPQWQADFPQALEEPAAAAAMLASLSNAKQVSFLARDWLAKQDIAALSIEATRSGVNILGHFSYPSGLRVSTESLVTGLQANGLATSLRDVPVGFEYDEPVGHAFAGCEIYDITIVHVQPTPFFDRAHERAGLRPRQPPTYRIGFWYWELDSIPDDWDRHAFDCDEIWTATHFVADGLRQRYRQPVNVFLPGIEMPCFTPLPRRHFKLDDDTFLFLFVFHMRSIMERKNPLALIKAFKAAFSPSDNVQLVIKTMSGSDVPDDFTRLQEEAAADNIILIDEVYSREETLSLIACCDAYVSLHRSEGLGLTMAEAMLLARPVIATRYSGNLEFMDDDNSLLVDCTLVTIDRPIEPYEAGQKWAAPSISQAAAHMRRLYDDPVRARELGARAKADLESRLSYRAAGERMKARITAIRADGGHFERPFEQGQ